MWWQTGWQKMFDCDIDINQLKHNWQCCLNKQRMEQNEIKWWTIEPKNHVTVAKFLVSEFKWDLFWKLFVFFQLDLNVMAAITIFNMHEELIQKALLFLCCWRCGRENKERDFFSYCFILGQKQYHHQPMKACYGC